VAPPSGNASRPGRLLVTLAVLIVAMFLAVVGGDIASPAKWHSDFQIKLGLDLTSGTTVTLRAQAPKGKQPSQTAMATAVTIMRNRVNASGTTEAQVAQQGSNLINVSVPGQNAQSVTNLVSRTAELQFRQVLLVAPNSGAAAATPTPTASSPPAPSTSPTASSPASAKPSASTKAKVSGARGGAGVRELGTGTRLAAAASASPSASASATGSASATPTPSPSSSTGTATWQQAQGDATLVSPRVKALFNKLDCSKKNWQDQVGYGQGQFNDAHVQTVSCGVQNGVLYKLALDKAVVTGTDITAANASLAQNSATAWEVNLSLNGPATKAFSTLTTTMYSKYFSTQTSQPTSILDDFAIVLDGTSVSWPYISQPITAGNATISGNFDQNSATTLANQLSYGRLPLSFVQTSVDSTSPQLGHDQLTAGLIAAAIGMILVVLFVLAYYRGLAVVSVFSLVTAAVLTYLSVILLGKYQHFALSLAGIAGLVVAIGITADSFVVYFERLRDEVREGKSLRTAVERGWARARRTILVSDTVSFLAAALLYFFAIGSVKGFAFTLGLTTVVDVVVVFLFTKPMVTLLARTKFYGQGHPLSGLDPARLGARAPWRASPRVPARSSPAGTGQARTSPVKEA
jgi:preprotein translocase subunit SecD